MMNKELFDGKIAVMLTFDVDGESGLISRDPANRNRPVTISEGAYGPKVGLGRILDVLAQYEVKCTFFVPGWIIEKWEHGIAQVVNGGHEIAHHGWIHERVAELGSRQAEEEILERGISAIEQVSGRRPLGYRAPGGEFSPHTLDLLTKAGFIYSSNFMDDDSPYFHLTNMDEARIVELPAPWHLEDAPFFAFSFRTGRQPYLPQDVLAIWTNELDVLANERSRCMVMILTPQHIGRPHRVGILAQFIEHAMSNDRVWIARCDEVAQSYIDYKAAEEGSPR